MKIIRASLLFLSLLAGIPATAHAQATVDARWGVLAQMVEKDMQCPYLVTMRWKTFNQVISVVQWGGGGHDTFEFELNATSGSVELFNMAAFGRRIRTGGYRVTDEAIYYKKDRVFVCTPIPEGSDKIAKVASLVAAGKVRAANPDLSYAAPQAPVVVAPAPRPAAAHSGPLPAAAATPDQGPRIALVVGNSTYGASLGNLTNPGNDARLIAAGLRAVGFQVELLLDADQRTLKRAISRLGERLSTSGRGSTGLFYYAGHGIQSRGVNYLIPVGSMIAREADVDLEAVAADTVLSQMEEAGTSTNIVILDACRNTPVARNFRSSSRGLARMEAPNGSFLSYSTAPGAVAQDGNGRNSPFAQALAAELQKPGQLIETTFRNVRRTVLQATGGQQTPWDASSLVDSFVFKE